MKDNLLLLKIYQNLKDQNLQIQDFNIKNMYIGKLANIINECNNTYHRDIRMKPVDVKSCTCIEY